jgi:hypothetical protein
MILGLKPRPTFEQAARLETYDFRDSIRIPQSAAWAFKQSWLGSQFDDIQPVDSEFDAKHEEVLAAVAKERELTLDAFNTQKAADREMFKANLTQSTQHPLTPSAPQPAQALLGYAPEETSVQPPRKLKTRAYKPTFLEGKEASDKKMEHSKNRRVKSREAALRKERERGVGSVSLQTFVYGSSGEAPGPVGSSGRASASSTGMPPPPGFSGTVPAPQLRVVVPKRTNSVPERGRNATPRRGLRRVQSDEV